VGEIMRFSRSHSRNGGLFLREEEGIEESGPTYKGKGVEGGIRGVLLIREKQRRRDRKALEGEKEGEEGANKGIMGGIAPVLLGGIVAPDL